MKRTVSTLFLSITLGIMMLSAQNTGKISGMVTDASTGEILIGANIILEGTRYGAVSDLSGEYVILKVPSGTYTLTASILGYSKAVTSNVRVLNDLTTTINFKLNQSAISQEEVIITAETPLIKKDLTATESRVTAEEIQNLPVQSLDQLISLQAGVSKDAGGGIHIRGGRSTEVSYLVNGISVTDDFSRTQALSVETESIQELQVISGTFNAEYGNAMSGVINVVTKTGGSKFRSSIEAWTGDYISTRNGIFWGIDEFSPIANYNFQGTVSGPLLSEDVSYYLSMRRYYNDGYLFGVNAYSPQGRTIAADSSFVSMNSSNRWSGQATFDWRASDAVTLKMDILGSKEANRFYSHIFRLNPNGTGRSESRGISIIPKLTYQFSQNTFQEITFAYRFNDNQSRLYDSPSDSRYVHSDSLSVTGYHFRVAGTNLNRFERNTKSIIAKWDLTSQIDKVNLFKMGVEWQSDKLFYENINLVPAKDATGRDIVPFIPSIEGVTKPNHDLLERHPVKFAAYLQNKIELQNMIINAGLRFELFDPAGKVPSDPEDPDINNPFKPEHRYHDLNGDGTIGLDEQTTANAISTAEREVYWYTKVKQKIS
ncbi:MAG: TonB-dependent receptor, partial [Bacteroidota bacterium]